jgi:hypothetical protein
MAADAAAKAAPDGYTALVTTGAFAANAVYYTKLPYDLVASIGSTRGRTDIHFAKATGARRSSRAAVG